MRTKHFVRILILRKRPFKPERDVSARSRPEPTGTIPFTRSDFQYYLIFKETAGTAWFDSGDLTWAP